MEENKKNIDQLIHDFEDAKEHFKELIKEVPGWDWAIESEFACDIMLMLLKEKDININSCAFFAYLMKKEFKRSSPPVLWMLADDVLNWARDQKGIIKYTRRKIFTFDKKAP